MKKLPLLVLIACACLINACKKELHAPVLKPYTYKDSALQYLKDVLRPEKFQLLDITGPQILYDGNRAIGIKIAQKDSINNFILIVSTNNGYKGNWVDESEIKVVKRIYSGVIKLEGLHNEWNTLVKVDSNKVTEVSNYSSARIISQNFVPADETSRTANASVAVPILPYEVLPTIFISIPVSGVDDETSSYQSMYWMLNQDVDMVGYYYPTLNPQVNANNSYSGSGYTSAGSPGNEVPLAKAPMFFPPDDPILSLYQELKCFTVNNTSTYSIAVEVNQPFPGSRDLFNPSAPFKVGHTYLSFEQHNADGTSVIRNVGFYPKNGVKPGNTADQSIFGDDSNTPFDVSLKFVVTGSELQTVITALLDQLDIRYDMNNFNCTNSPISALSAIKIALPSTKSMGPLFDGNDPADLGEDIKSLDLNSYSSQNGNRQISRQVSTSNSLWAPKRNGTC